MAIRIVGFVAFVFLVILCLVLVVNCQTITNADLNRQHRPMQDARTAAKILEPHQWQPPPYVPKQSTMNGISTGHPGDGPFGELKITPTPPAAPFIAPYWATWPRSIIGGSYDRRRIEADGKGTQHYRVGGGETSRVGSVR
jgi:hypothetical protein